MEQERGAECSYASVTLGPANVGDISISPFLEPQYSRPYLQILYLTYSWREKKLEVYFSFRFQTLLHFENFVLILPPAALRISIRILDMHKETRTMKRLYTRNTSTRVRSSRACFCYEYEIRINVYI